MRRSLLLLLVALFSSAHALPDRNSLILHHEALRVLQESADPPALHLAAYGRRWVLELEPNRGLERLRGTRGFRLLRGRIAGAEGSWVRLMRQGDALTGIVSDGRRLYGIEPRSRAAPRLLHPDTAPDTVNVVFRLDDLLLPADAGSCGTPPDRLRQSAASGVASIVREASAPAALPADGRRRLVLQLVADYEFFRLFGSGSEAEILSRLNIVDGIYLNQLNIDVEVGRLTVFEQPADPFTTGSPQDLLEELGNYRLASGFTRGPSQLMTGRDLDGTTRGIAYLGAACSERFGAAVSQQTRDAWISALTLAHEIAHTIGAWHDNEPSSDPQRPNPCALESPGFLMEATINGNERFSACSLQTIERFLASSSPLSACVAGTAVATGQDGGGSGLGPLSLAALLLLWRRRVAAATA